MAVVTSIWLTLLICGFAVLLDYATTEGPRAATRGDWPQGAILSREGGAFTLVMAVHPHCPCTKASLRELAKVVARASGRLTVHVLFLVPDGFEEDWAQTDLWREAGEIPVAQRTIDRLGVESQRFGASSSGATHLYDPAGRLVFRGGITASRGHEGDNAGEFAVLAFVSGRAKQAFVETPVFGCDLLDHSSPHACRLESTCPL